MKEGRKPTKDNKDAKEGRKEGRKEGGKVAEERGNQLRKEAKKKAKVTKVGRMDRRRESQRGRRSVDDKEGRKEGRLKGS